jgi:hypothetical protein
MNDTGIKQRLFGGRNQQERRGQKERGKGE